MRSWNEFHAHRRLNESTDLIVKAYTAMGADDRAKIDQILNSPQGDEWIKKITNLLKGKEALGGRTLAALVLGSMKQAAGAGRQLPAAAPPAPSPEDERLAQFQKMASKTSTNPIGTGVASPEQLAKGVQDREQQQVADKLKDVGAIISDPKEIARLKAERQIADTPEQARQGQHRAYWSTVWQNNKKVPVVRHNPHYQEGGAYD